MQAIIHVREDDHPEGRARIVTNCDNSMGGVHPPYVEAGLSVSRGRHTDHLSLFVYRESAPAMIAALERITATLRELVEAEVHASG